MQMQDSIIDKGVFLESIDSTIIVKIITDKKYSKQFIADESFYMDNLSKAYNCGVYTLKNGETLLQTNQGQSFDLMLPNVNLLKEVKTRIFILPTKDPFHFDYGYFLFSGFEVHQILAKYNCIQLPEQSDDNHIGFLLPDKRCLIVETVYKKKNEFVGGIIYESLEAVISRKLIDNENDDSTIQNGTELKFYIDKHKFIIVKRFGSDYFKTKEIKSWKPLSPNVFLRTDNKVIVKLVNVDELFLEFDSKESFYQSRIAEANSLNFLNVKSIFTGIFSSNNNLKNTEIDVFKDKLSDFLEIDSAALDYSLESLDKIDSTLNGIFINDYTFSTISAPLLIYLGKTLQKNITQETQFILKEEYNGYFLPILFTNKKTISYSESIWDSIIENNLNSNFSSSAIVKAKILSSKLF
jgi:hypothetical protein